VNYGYFLVDIDYIFFLLNIGDGSLLGVKETLDLFTQISRNIKFFLKLI